MLKLRENKDISFGIFIELFSGYIELFELASKILYFQACLNVLLDIMYNIEVVVQYIQKIIPTRQVF